MDISKSIPTNCGDWLNKFGDAWADQVGIAKNKFGASIENVRMPPEYPTDVPIVYVRREAIVDVLRFFKTDPSFEYSFLADITAVDEGQTRSGVPRFEVVYNLFSLNRHWRIRLKVRVREDESVPSASDLWPGANWAEREAYDMFGIKFSGHPDLRRILLDVRFKGHPLRKDYPIRDCQLFSEPQPIDERLLR